ncbi:MAG TPA: transferase, partial [Verrucomicrobiales bacterium]|nr:transferase [Verrucomicrobiales bacterium]
GDLVREGETGFLVNRGDAGEIATGVRGFFELPSHERRRMGERALAEYRDHYSREKNLELLTGIYRDAAAEVLARSTRQS